MLTHLLIVVAVAFVAFELVEHIVIPIVALRTNRNRRRLTGADGMIGKVAEVREWDGSEGRVFVAGALWSATSGTPLAHGDRAVVRAVRGLVLEVAPLEADRPRSPGR